MKFLLPTTALIILFATFDKIEASEECNCTIDDSRIMSERNVRAFVEAQHFDEENKTAELKLNFRSGKFEGLELKRAWCVDIGKEFESGEFMFDTFSSLDDPINFDSTDNAIVNLPDYFPSLNYLLNEYPFGTQIDIPPCSLINHTISDFEYRLAMWNIIDETHIASEMWEGKTEKNQCVVDYLFTKAQYNIDYEINCNDLSLPKIVSLILTENGSSNTSKGTLVAEMSIRYFCSCTGDDCGEATEMQSLPPSESFFPTMEIYDVNSPTFPPTNSLSPSMAIDEMNSPPSDIDSPTFPPTNSLSPVSAAPVLSPVEDTANYQAGGGKKQASIKLEKTVNFGPRQGNTCNPGMNFLEGSKNTIITYSFVLTNTGKTCLKNVSLVDDNLDFSISLSGILGIGREHRRCFQTIIENEQIDAEAHVYGTPADCLVGNDLLEYEEVESSDSVTVKLKDDENGECTIGQEVTEMENGRYIITRSETCSQCDCP